MAFCQVTDVIFFIAKCHIGNVTFDNVKALSNSLQ